MSNNVDYPGLTLSQLPTSLGHAANPILHVRGIPSRLSAVSIAVHACNVGDALRALLNQARTFSSYSFLPLSCASHTSTNLYTSRFS
eukprot:2546167-Amphidinium_carterae.1